MPPDAQQVCISEIAAATSRCSSRQTELRTLRSIRAGSLLATCLVVAAFAFGLSAHVRGAIGGLSGCHVAAVLVVVAEGPGCTQWPPAQQLLFENYNVLLLAYRTDQNWPISSGTHRERHIPWAGSAACIASRDDAIKGVCVRIYRSTVVCFAVFHLGCFVTTATVYNAAVHAAVVCIDAGGRVLGGSAVGVGRVQFTRGAEAVIFVAAVGTECCKRDLSDGALERVDFPLRNFQARLALAAQHTLVSFSCAS